MGVRMIYRIILWFILSVVLILGLSLLGGILYLIVAMLEVFK